MSKRKSIRGALLITVLAFLGAVVFFLHDGQNTVSKKEPGEITKADPVQTKIARSEYFSMLLRDPAVNRIPENIRARELNYSRQLPSRRDGGPLAKSTFDSHTSLDISWQSAGPNNLGGRTRALGIDQRNSDIILAGAVSGGMWKSTDGGASWEMKSDPNQNMSVTSLAQDPTDPDTWYYASGEYSGNSASDRGYTARYFGTGIYKSTDNGETWSLLSSTEDKDTNFNSRFDYISRLKVSPATGSLFAASNATGLLRSTDGGNSFTTVKADINEHAWIDFDIDEQGNITAIFSSEGFEAGSDPGVFYSADDGVKWTEITPAGFPADYDRSVIAFAPSDPDIIYTLSQKLNSSTNQGISFFKIDMEADTSFDRSANIPDFGESVGGMNLQGGYNMVISVKPDDPDFVLIGGTNLFRSRDGFATTPEGGYDNNDAQQKEEYWVGGYARANNVSQYPNQHPDQHAIAWEPGNPEKVWTGHDGGLSVTSDITAAPVNWQDKDDGYITAQFYTVAISPDSADQQVTGGTQDNGTPYFKLDDQNVQRTGYSDISSGDGSYSHIGGNFIYSSSQNGRVMRQNMDLTGFNYVAPRNASNQLFIHPYAVDPNDDGIMYYPGGDIMWRNTSTDEITNFNSEGATEGWESFEAVSEDGFTITTLAVTKDQPSDRLYYGAYASNKSPKIFYVDEASTTDNEVEISIENAPSGAYLHDLAVNPQNGDEILAVMSNYNIVGLYHSLDGGENWTPVEGNLEGDSQNPGPSIRNATILPTSAGTIYFVGTSTGVYSTASLSGNLTEWIRESDDGSTGSIGYSVAEFITSRPSDGKVAVGTHGRGIFMADVTAPGESRNLPLAAPANLTAETEGSSITLSWESNSGSNVSGYTIYRGLDSHQLESYATADASAASYTDTETDQQPYYYAVSAVDSEGNESPRSEKVAVFRGSLEISDRWQLVGSPLGSSLDAADTDAEIFGFDGVYQETNSLQPQKGYWMKSGENSSLDMDAAVDTTASISLQQGWNLVSGIVDTVDVTSLEDPENIRSSTDIYEYENGSYQSATEILPSKGYWIHANAAGEISLSTGGSSAKHQQEPQEAFDAITFSRGTITQQFYISENPVDNKVKARFRMPPIAPSPPLDIRTATGYRIADERQTELELTTKNYPVKIELSPDASSSYVLKGVTAQDTVLHKLIPGKPVDIQQGNRQWFLDVASNMISENDLLPNYPNPFNPTTNIQYKIATQTHVSLSVYDVLGRRVQTLVNEVQEPGTYTKTFNAQNLSSGMYFIRIKADNFRRVQQMTLIK